ncbi:MAG: SpoIVB peptidase S55 domain-containing protein, partial [Vicinamibacterales bacterium]|nr:SpoIVB peptidase S55 domain-containing protein [Vicinamibacterales bacterium]
MNFRGPLLFALVLTGAFLVALPAATVTMPVDEVRPGMRGTGVTVFQGTERSEFSAEIIGVLENAMGPRRNLILARLEGGPLAESGVIQGMSGSPVYVDGRLLGAVSYSMGSFPKDTIAGITPIAEMLRDDSGSSSRVARAAPRLPLPLATDTLTSLLPDRLTRPDPFATRPGDISAVGLSSGAAATLGVQLRPIATPLVMTGFTAEAIDHIAPMFRAAGMVAVVGGGVSSQTESDAPLQPGDAVGVSLIRGDLSMAGTGTVTHVDEGRLYA